MDYDFNTNISSLINQFICRYPHVNLIVKSIALNNTYYNYCITEKDHNKIPFNKVNANFSGTGDLFAALFIKHAFLNEEQVKIAISKTAAYLSKLIAYNVYFDKESYDLSILNSFSTTQTKGSLFYVVGPSGVGKDTLIDLAKKQLKNSNVIFAQRYITRDKNAGGEDHIAISKKSFVEKTAQNFFSLWWQSHDNFYGISSNINLLLENGFNVVVNGSRGYYEEAVKNYPDMKTILITAQESTIRTRLIKRNRENLEEIEKRIERSKYFQDNFRGKNIIVLSNDTALEVSGKAFIEILSKDYTSQKKELIMKQPILDQSKII